MRANCTVIAALLLAGLPAWTWADEVLHRYEGEVMPGDPSAGWFVDDLCDGGCVEFPEDGHFVFFWAQAGDDARYGRWIARAPEAPPFAVDRVALPLQSSPGPELLHM